MTGTVSTWIETATAVNNATGTAIPQLTLAIPAGSRLDRIVISPLIVGRQDPDTGVAGIGPVYYNATMTIARPTTFNRVVWRAQRVLKMEAVAIDDHLLLTKNRVYTAYHYGGDLELGDNLQMSYGGTGKPATNIRLQHGCHPITAGQGATFVVTGVVSLKALYHT